MASGVPVNPDCITTSQEGFKNKNKGSGPRLKYIIFTVNNTKTEIVVEKTSTDSTYENFLNDLPENEPRWALYDFEYDLGDAGKRSKIVFIAWSPDSATGRQKMLFSSSKAALRDSLKGIINADIQATDLDEVSEAALLQKLPRT